MSKLCGEKGGEGGDDEDDDDDDDDEATQMYSPASDCCTDSMNRRALVEPISSG